VFKSELIEKLVEKNRSLSRADIVKAVEVIQREIANSLATGGRVEVRGFGSFFLSYRRPRIARNPKTGETFSVGSKWLPRFKPGKKLREDIDAQRKKEGS